MSIYDEDGAAGYGAYPPAGPPLRPKPRPGLLLVALVLVTVLGAGVLVGGGYVLTRVFGGGGAADYSGSGSGSVTVTVNQGDSALTIGTALKQAGVVKSAQAFANAAADDDRSQTIQPGQYKLHSHMKGTAALNLMLDPASVVKNRVVIPEGFTLAQTLARISRDAKIPLADLQAAVKNPTAIGLPLAAQGRVEGFLFPATYDIAPGSTAVQALSQMTKRFGQAADDVNLQTGAAALKLSQLQVVIVASLLEREGKSPEEFSKIARVISNRLAAHMNLGLESTVRYALGDGADAVRLLQSQLDAAAASPYDTYTHAGLPPGPIGNPGQAALEAALNPTPGDWLYFVTLPKEGVSKFTNNITEFNTLVAQCRAEGGC